jgi:hypothetical protein
MGFEVFTVVVMTTIILQDMTARRHIPEDDTLHEKPVGIAGVPAEIRTKHSRTQV